MNIQTLSQNRLSTIQMTFDPIEIDYETSALIDPLARKSDLSGISPDISALYSTNKDVKIFVNGQFARGQITTQPMTNWYDINTGIVFHKSAGVNEPDGIKTTIFSKSERCYYLGTTEGLYRTYNDDFSQCQRILPTQITVNGDIELMAHVMNIVEIGKALYLLTVTGKTSSSVRYMIYDAVADARTAQTSRTYDGWRIASRLVSIDDHQAIVALSQTDESTVIDIVVVTKTSSTPILEVKSVYIKNGESTVTGSIDSTHFMSELGDKMFFSHHYSDNPSGKKYKGLTYTALSNITDVVETWPQEEVGSVQMLANSRVYQIRTIGDALYACCGLSGPDSLGLLKVTIGSDGAIVCQSLAGDENLSSFSCAKDIYYSENASKWAFCFGDTVYISDVGEDGYWTALSSTGYSVGDEGYPRFNEFGKLATIYSKTEDGEESMLESKTSNGGLIATLEDLTTKNVRVDGVVADPDEHGFIDIDIKKTIESSFVVVDQIPEIMDADKIYFVKKTSV